MTIYIIDTLGWAGAVGILLAYYWSSSNKIADSRTGILKYQAVNILGAIGLLANSFYYGAVPSVIVNLIWVGIAIHSLSRLQQPKAEGVVLQKA